MSNKEHLAYGTIRCNYKLKGHNILNSMTDTPEELSFKINPIRNIKEISDGIKILRSNKRKKTISARLVGGVMSVYAPVDISDSELKKAIDKLKKRLHNRKLKRELDKTQDLVSIAQRLNKKYFDNRLKIRSIEYASNQNRIFGCCNYKLRKIRISQRLMHLPYWVRDYVIIHEMAHLIEPNHSRAFWGIVYQYKLTERAKGYLMAKGFNPEEESADIEQAD